MRTRSTVAAAVCLATLVVSSGCGKTSQGEPVADHVESVAETASSAAVTAAPSTRAVPTPEAELTEYLKPRDWLSS